MKKIALFLCLVLCLSLFAGCSGNGGAVSTDMTTAEMSAKIQEAYPVAMSGEVDDMILTDIFYVDPSLVEEHSSVMSFANVSADTLAVIKAQSGKAEDVAAGLQKRLEDVQASFEMYLPDQYEKSKNGKVITKGDYVFLVILGGENPEAYADDMTNIETMIDGFFK